MKKPAVVVASFIDPSTFSRLDKSKILGIVSESGSRVSHFAIIARALNLPAVVCANIVEQVVDGESLLIDGLKGGVYLRPSPDLKKKYKAASRKWIDKQQKRQIYSDVPNETRDGLAIRLSANITWALEVEEAKATGAEGVGLYRTENILYTEESYPSEDDQIAIYTDVAKRMHPYKVTIRTFDIGGDKIPFSILKSIGYTPEENPYLGWRAIRISLAHPEYFKPQIRAILRMSADYPVRILLPMIISLQEVTEARQLIESCKSELKREKKDFDESTQVGIMMETPAATLLAEELAQQVDFFSIGTNDLVQYTLAVDRNNPKVAQLYNCFHPAVLRSIRTVLEAANKHGIEASMCGEMAANLAATELLIGIGLEEFSVSPSYLLAVKERIVNADSKQCRNLARKVADQHRLKDILELIANPPPQK